MVTVADAEQAASTYRNKAITLTDLLWDSKEREKMSRFTIFPSSSVTNLHKIPATSMDACSQPTSSAV